MSNLFSVFADQDIRKNLSLQTDLLDILRPVERMDFTKIHQRQHCR